MRAFWTALLASVSMALVGAQTSAPVVNLAGAWQRDIYLSDRPEQVNAAIRVDLGESLQPPAAEGLERGRGGRGFEPQGQNTRRRTVNQQKPLSDEEQKQFDEMTRMVHYPPQMLTIAQDAGTIAFTDEQGEMRTFHTDGKREKQTFGSATMQTAARWEGPQLTIDFDLTKGRSMNFTYSIVPTTRQLLVRIRFMRGPLEVGPLDVRQVYDRDQSH